MNSILWERPPVRLSISRSELHVWRINLDNINYQLKHLISLLSPGEIKRAKQFIFARDRHRYQITHSMKRLILANYLDCDPKCLKFELGKQGKPSLTELQNHLNIQFNISHSHRLILIAITAEDSIGIDVEYKATGISVASLSEIIFSREEIIIFSTLQNEQEKEQAIFRCWTRKEAFLKACGIGLMINIANITVDRNKFPEDCIKISTHHDQVHTLPCKFFTLDRNDYYIVVVVMGTFKKKLFYYDAVSLC
ncbi:MAG: 4'-phosphopantetheinyl transferase superfamily protein [Candidatus Aquirickettsiella sp.]